MSYYGALTSVQGQATTVLVTPVAPTEILVPFQFTAAGPVAVTSDPVVVATQHILSVVMTGQGERVMRPTYGANIGALTFATVNGQTLQGQIQSALNATGDNAYTVVSVTVAQNLQSPGTFLVTVLFQLAQAPQVYEAVFDSSGNLVGTT